MKRASQPLEERREIAKQVEWKGESIGSTLLASYSRNLRLFYAIGQLELVAVGRSTLSGILQALDDPGDWRQ
jgi:hypothetical protein